MLSRLAFFSAVTLAALFGETKRLELNVSAAASLRPALEEIKPLFEASQKNTAVLYNFGSSGALAQQILNGAKVDVFLSANPKQVFALANAGLVRSNDAKLILKNTLVLVVPKGALSVKSLFDLGGAKISKIALGEPKSVPTGLYAVEALKSLNLERALKDKFVFAKDASQVLTYVESANVEAGFVYLSDAMTSAKVDLALKVDPKLHSPIEYVGAPIKASAHFPEAGVFVKLLFENAKARDLFTKRGFLLPN